MRGQIELIESGRFFTEQTKVEGNVIHNVSLLGAKSANGRVYTQQAMEDAAKLYDGIQVFANHPGHQDLTGTGGRRFEDLAGKVLNARAVGDRVKGDVQLLTGEPIGEKLKKIAEEAPELAGFSHRARGQARTAENGTQIIERILEVMALEIVVDPATTKGLFESKEQTVKKVVRKSQKEYTPVDDRVIAEAAVRLFGRPLGEGFPQGKSQRKPVTDEVLQEAMRRLFV